MAPHSVSDEGGVPMPIPKISQEQYPQAKVDPQSETQASNFLHRSLTFEPRRVVSASGIYLTLSTGQRILDATSGPAVSCLGHGNRRVIDAMQRQQLEETSYVCSMFYTTRVAEELADELIKGTGGKMARAWIANSGSEAMEAAMKLARQYFLELSPSQPSRTKFIARKESYHGTTLGSLSMGGHVTRREKYEPLLLPNITHVSCCNEYRGVQEGESVPQYVARLAQELDNEFQRQGPENVIAFVAEPVVGAALGCVPAVEGYFKAMRAVCDKYGALLILDEVMSGMGRCGTLHAWEQEGIVPDIETIGKGLGGGYAPAAGLLIGHKVIDVLAKGTGAFAHGHTYQGHPLVCAAALEVQRVMREEKLVENCAAMGRLLGEGLKQRLSIHPNVGNIRGKGLFWGIEFVKDKKTKEPFDPKKGVAMGVHEKGMLEPFSICMYPCIGCVDGRTGDHVIISPPYIVTKEDVANIVELSAKAIEAFFQEIPV